AAAGAGGRRAAGCAPLDGPAWEVAGPVRALPSLQAAPSGFAGFEHAPVAGSQVPASWHWSAGAQATGFVPLHSPAWQVSVRVQVLPSLQAAASGFAGFEHAPVAGTQAPAAGQWSAGAQVRGVWVPRAGAGPASVRGVAGSQVPASWHWSAGAQVTGVCVQPAGEQASIVQGLLSSQLADAPSIIAVCVALSKVRTSAPGEATMPSVVLTRSM